MPSLYQNIRGALQNQALTAVGFPAANQVSYEGAEFSSTHGVSWAKLSLMPQRGRSAVIGAAQKLHSGLFQVDIFDPARGGPGTGGTEAKADAVKAVFAPGTVLTLNGERVVIDYSERAAAIITPDWIQVPVTVGWRCYSSNN